MFAKIIAEWDATLTAKVVDASVPINTPNQSKPVSGPCNRHNLYSHRQAVVCDAVRGRFGADVR